MILNILIVIMLIVPILLFVIPDLYLKDIYKSGDQSKRVVQHIVLDKVSNKYFRKFLYTGNNRFELRLFPFIFPIVSFIDQSNDLSSPYILTIVAMVILDLFFDRESFGKTVDMVEIRLLKFEQAALYEIINKKTEDTDLNILIDEIKDKCLLLPLRQERFSLDGRVSEKEYDNELIDLAIIRIKASLKIS